MQTSASADRAVFTRPAHTPGLELVSVKYRRRRFPVHTHGEFVVGAVVAGAETLSVNGRSFLASVGASLFLHPDEPHANATIGDATLAYRVFYIPSEALSEALDGKLPTFAAPVAEAPAFFDTLVHAHQTLTTEHGALEQQCAFAMLAQSLAGAAPPGAVTARRPSIRTQRMKDFIEEHYADDFSLADLAESAGLSRVHTLRSFKQDLGMTPIAYRNQVRLAQARRLLRSGLGIADTTSAVGFADQSHLHRHFQRVVGVSPARYARQ